MHGMAVNMQRVDFQSVSSPCRMRLKRPFIVTIWIIQAWPWSNGYNPEVCCKNTLNLFFKLCYVCCFSVMCSLKLVLIFSEILWNFLMVCRRDNTSFQWLCSLHQQNFISWQWKRTVYSSTHGRNDEKKRGWVVVLSVFGFWILVSFDPVPL
jgi:hypothetical protein